MSVSQDTVQAIKTICLSEAVGNEGGYLKRVGREFVTHCLWHDDSNPSLTINDDKGFAFCHVCQHSSDVIGYIQQKLGLSFIDAVEHLAKKNNIEVKYNFKNPDEYKKRFAEMMDAYDKAKATQEKYRSALKNSTNCVEYIISRAIEPSVSREFALGFSASENRLTIPIHNHKGDLIGWTKRALNNEIKPKYKNTENNIIFNKSEIVFNEHRAAPHIREKDQIIFVEGHLDVVTLWQAGHKNVVALQGTASPSPLVLKRLLRKSKSFVLCMDRDSGGKLAVEKFIQSVQDIALQGDLDVKVVNLPVGHDPDEVIKKGGSMQVFINCAVSWIDWILDNLIKDLDFDNQVAYKEVEQKVKDLVRQIHSPGLRSHYIEKAANRLARNKQTISAEITKDFRKNIRNVSRDTAWKKPTVEQSRKKAEIKALRLYINNSELRPLLRPIMEKINSPYLLWLWERIQELEKYSSETFNPLELMALLVVAEKPYIEQLRSIVKPSIRVIDDEKSLWYIEDKLYKI